MWFDATASRRRRRRLGPTSAARRRVAGEQARRELAVATAAGGLRFALPELGDALDVGGLRLVVDRQLIDEFEQVTEQVGHCVAPLWRPSPPPKPPSSSRAPR